MACFAVCVATFGGMKFRFFIVVSLKRERHGTGKDKDCPWRGEVPCYMLIFHLTSHCADHYRSFDRWFLKRMFPEFFRSSRVLQAYTSERARALTWYVGRTAVVTSLARELRLR